MSRLTLLTTALLLASAPAVGAQPYPTQSTPAVASGGIAPEASGDGSAMQAEQLLANFDRSAGAITPTERTYTFGSSSGFVFGTGPANTKTGQVFTFPNGGTSGTALGVNLYFYSRSATPAIPTYRVQVWSGSAQTGPQTELYSESFPISGIQLNSAGPVATSLRFATPVPVRDETFFIVLPFDLSDVNDRLALYSTQQLSPVTAPESWHFVSPNWSLTSQVFSTSGTPLESYALIEALIDDVPVSRESLPEGVTAVSLYPNPARSASALSVDLTSASGVRVAVLDMQGRNMATVYDGTLPAGRQRLDLPLADLPVGTYAVRAQIDGAVVTRMLTVTR